MRLDKYLTENGIYKSRTRAARAIEENCVKVNGIPVTKASFDVREGDVVDAADDPLQYVSRGALKLEHALNLYNIAATNLVCADIGASTGGFTEVLLNHGATKIFAIDVGEGQLAPSVALNPCVINMEKTDARDLPSSFDDTIDLVTCDCSFISLKLILPTALRIMKKGAHGIFLIKPQFEVGPCKAFLGKNGVVKDEKVRLSAVKDVCDFARGIGFTLAENDFKKIPESPIKGGDGNVEYLLCVEK